MALGIDSGGVFNRVTGDFSVLTLERDDCLVLYTDGVTEALDSDGDEFGMANVIQSIQASAIRRRGRDHHAADGRPAGVSLADPSATRRHHLDGYSKEMSKPTTADSRTETAQPTDESIAVAPTRRL